VTTARLETFADGVFAIAATLLIIDVGLPAQLDDSLAAELLDIWPQYLAYAISFATIGIIWVNHHVVLAQVARADRAFLFLTLALLLSVAFIPFPTRVLAEFVRTDNGQAAALLYGFTMLTMSAAFLSVWLYASVGREADPAGRGSEGDQRNHQKLSTRLADVRRGDARRARLTGGERGPLRAARALLRRVDRGARSLRAGGQRPELGVADDAAPAAAPCERAGMRGRLVTA